MELDSGAAHPTPGAATPTPSSADFPLYFNMGRGLTFSFDEDFAVLRATKKDFNEPCFALALKIGPLPGVHCSVVVVLRPGDLLKVVDVDSETSFRHLDPKTANRLHSSEALAVLRLPDIVKNEQVGTGLHAVSAFGWVVRERGALLKSRAPASAENPMVQGLRALKSALVECVKRCVAERRSALANHPTGPSTTPLDDDGIETKTASQAGVDRPAYSGAHDTRTSGHVGGGGEADLVGGEERRAGSVEESSTDSESESGSEEEEDEEEEEEERAGKKAVGAEADTDADHGAGRDPTSTGGTGAAAASAGDKPRRKAPVHGQPASTTSSKSAFAAALAHVKRLEEENRKLRDENTGLRSDLVTERGRAEGLLATAAECLAAVKSLTERVAAAEQTAGTHISTATAAMTGVFTKVLDDRVALVKACSSMATPLLGEITKGLDKLAVARRDADVRLGNHVTSVGDNVKAVLADYIQTKLASTSTNIVGGLSRSIAPPPPGPSPALPEEVIKAMRDDIVQAVTAVTQQALGTVGFTLLPNVLATMRLGRRGSSPSAGDLESAQRQRPEKRAGSGSAADGDNTGNSKRSKGVGGERAVGGDVPDRAQSGGAGGSSEGRTAAEEGVRAGGSSTHGGGRKGPEIPRPGASEVAPPPSDRGNVAVESVEVQADAAIPTINTATGASTNAGLFPTGVDRGPPFEVEAPSIGDQTHQAPVVGVGGDTGALGVEDTGDLGVEDDPVARALMEELLAFQAPSQQQPVAIDNAAVPTTRGGAQHVAGTAPTAPVSADVNARHTAAPSADPPTTGPIAAPTTGQDNAGQTLTDPVAAMLLAAVNSFQAAAPSSHPPTTVTSAAPTMQLPAAVATPSDPVSDMLMAEVNALSAGAQSAQPQTHGTRTAPTTVNLAEPVHQEAANETVPTAVPTHHQVGAASGQGDWGAVAGDDGAGEIPLIIEDEDVELIQAAMEVDEVAALQSTVQLARLASTGVSVAGQAIPPIQSHPAGFIQVDRAFQTDPTGVSGADQAGLAGPSTRPTAVTVATQAVQAVPPIQSHPAGFIQVDRAFQTGPSGVTGSDQAGLAGQSTRPTAVTVATQAGQAGPSDRSAGVTVADLAGQAGTSTVLAGGPVGEHADKDGQTDRAAGVGEKKKKRKGKAAASQKAVVPKDRRGHGIRLDRTSGGGWQGEVNLAGKSRYTGRSDDRMEVAYLNGVATTIFDGHASQVLLAEMTGVKAEEMTRWKAEWEEAKVMPKGMWTVMWSRGATMFRACRPSASSSSATSSTALGPVAADAVPKTGADAKRIGQAVAASSCAVWCFAETVAEVGNAAGEAKAAALLCEASTDFADTCHDVVVAVLETAVARQPVLGEVSCNVTDALQKDALQKACKGCNPTPDAEIIARATIETLAFWGSCNAGGPLLRARGIQVPLDKQMEKDMDNRGKKGQKGKHAA
ncbi:unnamed protein product [Closterium sp. Naga37s-1]|nr:unnamed protein product [Closterium sp. Naga37s-1]